MSAASVQLSSSVPIRPAAGTSEGVAAARLGGAFARALGLAVAALVALGAGGCSGADATQRWREQARAACGQIQAEADAVPVPGPDLAEVAAFAERVRAVYAAGVERLNGLEPPSDAAATSLTNYFDRQLTILNDVARAARAKNPDLVNDLFQRAGRELEGSGREIRERWDLPECAPVGTPVSVPSSP